MKKTLLIVAFAFGLSFSQPSRQIELPGYIKAPGKNMVTKYFTIVGISFDAKRVFVRSEEGKTVAFCFSNVTDSTIVCKNKLSSKATQALMDAYLEVYGQIPTALAADYIE